MSRYTQPAPPEVDNTNTMPTNERKTAKAVAPKQHSEAKAQRDQLTQEPGKQRPQMPSRESALGSLTAQISAMQALGMTSAEIRDALVSGGVPNRRS